MVTAKKLPSGSWRCQVYSHTEEIIQIDGTVKKKEFISLSPVMLLAQKENGLQNRQQAYGLLKKKIHTVYRTSHLEKPLTGILKAGNPYYPHAQ